MGIIFNLKLVVKSFFIYGCDNNGIDMSQSLLNVHIISTGDYDDMAFLNKFSNLKTIILKPYFV